MRQWLLTLLLLTATCVQAAFSELRVPEKQDRAVVFAGREVTIEVRVSNDAAEVATTPVEYRVFQIANRIVAPLGERKPWKDVPLLARQTGVEKLAVVLPELRAVSQFRVVFYSGEKVLGHRSFVAFPQTLLANFNFAIACGGELANLLQALGMKVSSFDEVDGATIAILHAKDASAVEPVRSRAKALVNKGVPTVLLMPENDVAGSQRGLFQWVTGIVTTERGRSLISAQLDLSQFETSAEAQLDLYQLLRLASSSDEFPWND